MSDRVIAVAEDRAKTAHYVANYALNTNGPSLCGRCWPRWRNHGWFVVRDLSVRPYPLCKLCQRIDARTVMSDGTNAAD